MRVKKSILLAFCLLPTLALALDAPAPDVIRDNAGLFQWVLGIAIVINGVFIGRFLLSHDRQWKAIAGLDRRLAHLEGEHEATHGRKDDA